MAEIFVMSRGSLRRLLIRPRFWVSLLLALGCVLIVFSQIPAYLSAHEYKIQIVEPFMILLPGRFPQIIFLISFLLLVGDIPFLFAGLETTVIRSSRKKWFAAQILSALGAAVLWLLFVLFCTILLFGRQISIHNQWSAFLKAVARVPNAAYNVKMGLLNPTVNLFMEATPYRRFVWTFLFQLFLFWTISLWSLMFNVWTRRSYGCILTVGFWVIRRVVADLEFYLKLDLSLISPLSLVDFCEHRLTAARAIYILLFFVVQICVLWSLSALKLRQMDLSMSE
ncbi:MAG: hypothetical protein II885_18215 [Oscillospiraceae bacterium]|nr:hypothetical protein [Oscillospiraceae bacterium]